MSEELVIEYPSIGKTYSHDEYGVYQYGEYPAGSVLEGQERRAFLDSFETLAEAKAAYPQAAWQGDGSHYTEREVSTTAPAWFDPEAIGERWNEDD